MGGLAGSGPGALRASASESGVARFGLPRSHHAVGDACSLGAGPGPDRRRLYALGVLLRYWKGVSARAQE